MNSGLPTRDVVAACILIMLVDAVDCAGVIADGPGVVQSNRPDPNTRIGNRQQPVSLQTLPAPPPELGEMIRKARVKFAHGGLSSTRPKSFVGETRFTFRYRYDSRARWTELSPSSSTIRLHVRFRSVKFFTEHEVWLKTLPDPNAFWKDRVVRHEFDHVRISSDPRIEQQFLSSVEQLKSIDVPRDEVMGQGGSVSSTKVRAVIETKMQELIERITEYTQIRYQELDRITAHGTRPLPDPPPKELFGE